MRQEFKSEQFTDADGAPAGGQTFGPGFAIAWQNGPLGRGTERKEPNGAFVETIIAAARDRLEFYQRGKFACKPNAEAIELLNAALEILDWRTKEREARGVEGTLEK